MSIFARELAEKWVSVHREGPNGDEFIHLRDPAGVAVLSVGPRLVHCPAGQGLERVRAAVVGFVEAGIEEGRRQAGTPSPEALAAAREEGRRAGWAEALAVATRQVAELQGIVKEVRRDLRRSEDEARASEMVRDAIRKGAP